MSTKVGDIFVRANLDDKQYRKGLSNLDKFSGGIAKKMGRAFTVAGLGLFVKKATEAGASLNAMGTIIDASLPHMTKQVDDFARSAGAMFGLSETQAKGFVGKFASMASAMGYTEKEAYNMSTALTALAGDVASYYHISQDDAYAKLGAVFTGETEALKGLGVVMTQNALDAFALQQGYGAVTSQMSELEKTTLRYQFVMDRLKLASGDFAKYAYTWSGSIAQIKVNWSNFMATIGQGIINILLPLLQLIARISYALTALGARFLAWTKSIMGIKSSVSSAFGKKTQKDLKTANTGLSNIGSGLGGAGKQAKGAKKAVQALKRELMGFDKITKLTGENGTGSGGGTIGGGGLGGIGAGGIDFGDAEADIASFTEKAKDYLSNIKLPPALVSALNELKTSFSNLFDTLKNAGKWAYDNVLKPLAQWTIDKLLPVSIETLAKAFDALNEVLKFVGKIVEPLWNTILKPFLTWLGNSVIIPSIKGIGDAFEFVGKVFSGLNNTADTLKKKFADLQTWWNNLKLGKKEGEVTLVDKIKDAWNKLKTWWDGLKVSTKNFSVGFVDNVKKAWDTFKKWWDKLKGGSKSFGVKFTFTDSIKKGWNALAKKVNDARKTKLGKKLLPSMPYLAEGGYVKANTPQLAVIGDNKREGEIVAPESKLRAMAQEVAGAGNADVVRLLSAILVAVQNKDSNVYLDGEQIKNNVVRRINNHTRATGQLELIV